MSRKFLVGNLGTEALEQYYTCDEIGISKLLVLSCMESLLVCDRTAYWPVHTVPPCLTPIRRTLKFDGASREDESHAKNIRDAGSVQCAAHK